MSPFRGAFSSARSDSVSGVSVRLLGVLAVDFVFDLDDGVDVNYCYYGTVILN